MKKRIAGLVFLLALFSVPAFLFASGSWRPLYAALRARREPLAQLEKAVAAQFPFAERLRNAQVSLKYLGGNKEQNGVFISENALMLDLQPPESADSANANLNGIRKFVRDFEVPSYLMLIPTACAVQQSKVPAYADVYVYDQRAFIDDAYRRLSGMVNAIDVYPTLFSHQDEYIYYRTDNALTGLGGYYVYTAATKKLGDWKVRGLEEFDIQHIDYGYYGDLYQRSPYRQVAPDRVSIYLFSKFRRYYTVNHYDVDGTRRYYTLYPEWKKELGGTMAIPLGGMSPIVDISMTNYQPQQSGSLLLFGDRTAQAYLPFLLANYRRVTLVDTAQVGAAQLSRLDVEGYNQVLFAYSVDSFVLSDHLSRLGRLPRG